MMSDGTALSAHRPRSAATKNRKLFPSSRAERVRCARSFWRESQILESQIEHGNIIAAASRRHGKRLGERGRTRPSQHPDAIDRPAIVLVGPRFGDAVRE